MQKRDVFQALTLWFVVAIFFKIDSTSAGGPLLGAVGFVGFALLVVIPVYILLELFVGGGR